MHSSPPSCPQPYMPTSPETAEQEPRNNQCFAPGKDREAPALWLATSAQTRLHPRRPKCLQCLPDVFKVHQVKRG